jgi:hypothetical protein
MSKLPGADSESEVPEKEPKSELFRFGPVLGLGGGCGGMPVEPPPMLDTSVLDERMPVEPLPVLDERIPVEPLPVLDERIPVEPLPVLDLGVNEEEEERTRWTTWFRQRLEAMPRVYAPIENEEWRIQRMRKGRKREDAIDKIIEKRVRLNFGRYMREFPWIGDLPQEIAFVRMRDAYRDIVELVWYRGTALGHDRRYPGSDGYNLPRDEIDWQHMVQDITLLRLRRAHVRNPEFESNTHFFRIGHKNMGKMLDKESGNIEKTLREYLKRIKDNRIVGLPNIAPYVFELPELAP